MKGGAGTAAVPHPAASRALTATVRSTRRPLRPSGPTPQVLATSADLKTSACCTAGAPPPLVRRLGARQPRSPPLLPARPPRLPTHLPGSPSSRWMPKRDVAARTFAFTWPTPQVRAALAKVPAEVQDKYYGCGSPLPMGITGLR